MHYCKYKDFRALVRIFFFVFSLQCSGFAFGATQTLENFNQWETNQIWQRINASRIIEDCDADGANNKCLRITYKPNSRGSQPLVYWEPIEQADHYVLSYDVFFEPGFEFVRGGKLPGLGSQNPTTGCQRKNPRDWSVRLMWTENGGLRNYLYDQDRVSRCGVGAISDGPVFERGR